MKTSEIVTLNELCSQGVELFRGCMGYHSCGKQLLFTNGMPDFYTGKRTAGRSKGLEAQHRTREPFHGAMILGELSERVTPAAGLQNRACRFPSTRLLKRGGFCQKYPPTATDPDDPRVADRDSDGGPPPDCGRSCHRGAACGAAPPETPRVRRRGHSIHTVRVGRAARGLPGGEYRDRGPVVWPHSASRQGRGSPFLSPGSGPRWALPRDGSAPSPLWSQSASPFPHRAASTRA